jgi:ACS family tartrate transporter-like MFS transporter
MEITQRSGDNTALLLKVTRHLVPLLTLLYIIAWLDRVNVGFAALQMNRDLAFSPVVYGFGAGLFFLSYAALEVPSNLALARFGARRWIGRIMISWGILSIAMMLIKGPLGFYVLRFLLGGAEAGFFPGIVYYIGTWFPRADRARILARFAMAMPLASIVGGPIAGGLLGLKGVFGLAGWQWLFLAEGIPAVLLGIFVLRYLPDSPAQARWLSPLERKTLTEALRRDDGHTDNLPALSLKAILSNAVVWRLGLSFAFGSIGSYGLQFWMPVILKALSKDSDLMVGFISALPYVPAALAMVLIGKHSDQTRERCLHAALPCFLAAFGFAAASGVHRPAIAILALSLAAIGIYGRHGPFWSLPTLFFTGRAAAAAIALVSAIGSIGGFVGPYVVGLLKSLTGGDGGALLFLSAAMTASGLILLPLRGAINNRALGPRPV